MIKKGSGLFTKACKDVQRPHGKPGECLVALIMWTVTTVIDFKLGQAGPCNTTEYYNQLLDG